MSTRQLVVIGGGGFGREVLDIVAAVNSHSDEARWLVVGVLDDAPSPATLARLADRSCRYLGPVEPWLEKVSDSFETVVAVGSPLQRKHIVDRLDEAYAAQYPTLVHPDASVGSLTTLHSGTVVCAGARISTNVVIGRHAHINANAAVGHDTTLSDFVSVNPGAMVSGDCAVDAASLIGAGSVVLQGLQIGARATVGAGACVVRSVPSDTVVKGVPAR